MKKIVLTIIIFICINPIYTFADGACLIQDKSAEVLLKYIKNNKLIVKNVNKAVGKDKVNTNNQSNDAGFFEKNAQIVGKDLSKAKNDTISIFSQIFNFTGFYSYFRYYAVFPISNEVPFQVKRDYKILDRESKGMVEYVKSMDTSGFTDTIVKDACNGVESNCNLNNKSAKDIITELIKNNDKVLDLYRLTVMGESDQFNGDLILVDNNFELEIGRYYGKEAISACNSIEGGFFETISTAIQNISLLNQQGEDGIQMWRDAWDLMLGKEPDTQALAEKELLRSYLSNEGVSLSNQEIMTDNLEKYNEGGLSENNNFFTNTISSTFSKIGNGLKDWKDAIVGDFFEKKQTEVINYTEIKEATDNSKISMDIKEKISIMYNEELPFAAIGDINTEQLRAKIIETHMSLDDSINILENTIKDSQKVCNSQDKKRGICQ
ncbi:MAG: hypothetical protein PHS49_01650 [Candidatus Gracilibacteria bacterium]|nr:hypothetical protein [Candidatus Gracilibacteria bacterium]